MVKVGDRVRVMAYDLSEFLTGAWAERAEHESEDLDIDHVRQCHISDREMPLVEECAITVDKWPEYVAFFHHQGLRWELWLYHCNGWDTEKRPRIIEPVFVLDGTTFDGVRGGGGSPEFFRWMVIAPALDWARKYLLARWPELEEWV